MGTRLLTFAFLAIVLSTPVAAAEIGGIGEGARHPSYTPNRFDRRSTGAGRNDALGKTREEIRRGNSFNRRELGSPSTPDAWDRDRDGGLSQRERKEGFFGRRPAPESSRKDLQDLGVVPPEPEIEPRIDR